MEVGDILDETFRIYRRHFLLCAATSVILAPPAAGLAAYGFFTIFGTLIQSASTGQQLDVNSVLPSLSVLLVGYLITIMLSPFSYGAVIYAACESALGRPVTIWGTFRGVLRRYFAILGFIFV